MAMDEKRRKVINAQIEARLFDSKVRLKKEYRVKEHPTENEQILTGVRAERYYIASWESIRDHSGDIQKAKICVDRVLQRDPDIRLRIENHRTRRDDSGWSVSGGGCRVEEDEMHEAMAGWALAVWRKLDREEAESNENSNTEE